MSACSLKVRLRAEHLERDGEIRRAVIAVNNDVGDGEPVDLRNMNLEQYLRNPIVQYGHDRWQIPVGRTETLTWTNKGLEAEFTFLENDSFAYAVRNAWDQKVLRGASIGVRPTPNQPGQHDLLEWSIVNIPADDDAVTREMKIVNRMVRERMVRGKDIVQGEDNRGDPQVDEKQVAILVRQMMTEEAQEKKARSEAEDNLVDRFEKLLEKQGESFEKRLSEIELRMGDGKKKAADDDDEDGQKMKKKMKKKGDDDDDSSTKMKKKGKGEKAEDDEDDMEEKAEKRAELLVFVRDLLPKDFETRGQSEHDILVAAAGEEIPDAKDKSADYLRAKIETILERREDASNLNVRSKSTRKTGNPPSVPGLAVNMHALREMKQRSA